MFCRNYRNLLRVLIQLHTLKLNFYNIAPKSTHVHFGPKNEKFHFFLRKFSSPLHKLSNDIWYDYIWRKPVFDLFWAILGHFQPQNWKFHFFLHHLFISFPTIYDTTMFEENPFLTFFGPFWGRFGAFRAQKWKFSFFSLIVVITSS